MMHTQVKLLHGYHDFSFLTSLPRTSGWELFTTYAESMNGMEDAAHMDSLLKWRVARNTWPWTPRLPKN